MVPEVVFRPNNIGLNQAGVAEAVQQALQAVHPALQGLLYTNIILTGGRCCHSLLGSLLVVGTYMLANTSKVACILRTLFYL